MLVCLAALGAAPAAAAPPIRHVFVIVLENKGFTETFGATSPAPYLSKTLADQLQSRGLTWRGYMQDMGNSATEAKTCRHPAMNSQDKTQSAEPGDQYAARHNPFVYFHSIIDDTAACNANVVPLDRLPADLASPSATRNYTFITPNLCDDAHSCPLPTADAWLRHWVPLLLASRPYRSGDTALFITFDEDDHGEGNRVYTVVVAPSAPRPRRPRRRRSDTCS